MGIKWYHTLIFAYVIIQLAFLSVPGTRESGMLLSRGRRYKEARANLLKTLAKNPYDRAVLLELADNAERAGDISDAFSNLHDYLKRYPDDDVIRIRLAKGYVSLFRLQEAVALLQEGTLTAKSEPLLLSLYEQLGLLADAVALHERLLNGNVKNDSRRLREIIRLDFWQGNIEKAGIALRKLAEIAPSKETELEVLRLYAWIGDMGHARDAALKLMKYEELETQPLREVRMFFLRDRNVGLSVASAKRVFAKPDANEIDCMDLVQLLEWSGDSGQAFKVIFAGIEKFPKSEMLLRQAAYLAFLRKDFKKSVAISKRIAQLTGREDDWRASAQLYADAGDIAEARRLLDVLLARKEYSTETVYLSAKMALSDKDVSGAEGMLERLTKMLDATPADVQMSLQVAELMLRLGWRKRYIAQMEKIMAAAKLEPEKMLELAYAYNDAGMPGKALTVIDKVVAGGDMSGAELRRARSDVLVALLYSDKPDVARAELLEMTALALKATLADSREKSLVLELAKVRIAQGRSDVAASLLVELENVPRSAFIDLADAYAAAKRYAETENMIDRVRSSFREMNAEELARIAGIYSEMQKYPEAIDLYVMADGKSGGKREILLALADAYGEVGQKDKQYAIVDELARTGGEEDWMNALLRRQWNGDYESQEEILSEALKKFPDNHTFLAYRVQALAMLGRAGEARGMISQLLRSASINHNPSLMKAVATALMALGDKSRAAVLYGKVLELEPDDAEVLLELALIKADMRKFTLANKYFRRYTELIPGNAGVWFRFGEAKYEAGLSGAAEYAKALRYSGEEQSGEALAMRARIRSRQGKASEAVRLYEKAVSVDGDNVTLRCDYVDYLMSLELFGRAWRVWQEVADRWPEDMRVRRLRAALALSRKDYGQALALLRQLVREYPADAAIQENLAYAEDACGNPHAAIRHYRMAMAAKSKSGGQ